MKKLVNCIVAALVLGVLTGCGSIKPLKVPPHSDNVLIVPSHSDSIDVAGTTSLPKKNVTLVMIENDRSFTGLTESRALSQVKELMDQSNHFGVVTADKSAKYEKISDVPNPQDDEFILGVTIKEKEYVYSGLVHAGKVLLNLATLTISSTVWPFSMDNSSVVTLSLIGSDGPIETYSAEATSRRFWSSWSFGQLKTLVENRVVVHKQALISAVNQLVAEEQLEEVKTSSL